MGILSKLRWYDWAVLIGGLALVGWLELRRVDPSIAEYPPGSTMQADHMPLSGSSADQVFREDFMTGGYFGAFVLGKNGFGWTTDYNALSAAIVDARTFCERNTTECEVIATITPEGGDLPGDVTLANDTRGELGSLHFSPGAKALAISENGAWGSSFGNLTIWQARAEAISQCLLQHRAGQADYLPVWPCRVVWSRWF